MALSTRPYPHSIRAAVDHPDPQPSAEVRQPAVRYAVAAIVLQAGVEEIDSADLTAVATRLADDARRLLQESAPGTPVRAAVAVSAPPAGEVAGEERTDAGFAADRLAADRLVDGFTADGLAGRLAGGALTGPTAGAGRGAVRAAPGRSGEPAQLDPVVIDRDSRYASVADRALDLTYREFELLAVLAEHPGRVFTREHLLRTAWNHAAVGSRTVDVHVRRLRIKLGPEARRLTTIRNVGYRFEPAPAGRIAATLETVA